MAKKPDDKPEQEPQATPQAAPAPPAGQVPQQQRVQVQIDDKHAVANYANFCRVTGTPEELIIDFGLNPQPIGVPTQPIPITQRIITNFYTAKRMLHALTLTVQRHEAIPFEARTAYERFKARPEIARESRDGADRRLDRDLPELRLRLFGPPDFEVETLEGETVRLSALRGKVVLLEFWGPG